MFAKRLLQKAMHHHQHGLKHGNLTPEELDLRIDVHYGIPSTSSILAFDAVQRLLAIATLDGKIKVIGGDGIEGLFISSKQLPYKYLEFLQNQGFLVSISNDNDIQVWNLETRSLACCLQWESNITAFSVISGSPFMYIGDEYGLMSVMKYHAEAGKLLQLPYNLSPNSLSEVAGFSIPDDQPIVGILPQPCSSGNRVIIAYENGLIILWDASEAQVLFVGGGKDLQLKDAVETDIPDDSSEQSIQEKEISALCWASSDGSFLAVGYIDGDILLWNTSSVPSFKGRQNGQSKNIVKLQLSSAESRLPVIVLHWSANDRSHNRNGRLFIYGGDEIGSEEVLTVLSLEWSSGTEIVMCVGRVDLILVGSFADMILLPSAGATGGNHKADIFVLTNPGQLHLYDDASLSNWLSQKERRPSVCPVEFPMVIPTADPLMTITKLSMLPTNGISSKGLSEAASVMKLGSQPTSAGGSNWPLTGGVPSQLSVTKDNRVERVYIAGYKDGSVRIWDASFPVLSLICVIEGEVQGIDVAASSASVSALNFCWLTLSLAVGDECGLVRIFNLGGSSGKTSFHYVTKTNHEIKILPERKGPQCTAVFSALNSPVQALQFGDDGARLAVGFESSRIAVLDINSSSILFFTDCGSVSSSSVISMSWVAITHAHGPAKSSKQLESKVPVPGKEAIFILTKDAKISSIDGSTGNMISSRPWHLKKEDVAISIYVIESSISVHALASQEQLDEGDKHSTAKSEQTSSIGTDPHENQHLSSSEAAYSVEESFDTLVLLCCEKSLRLYSIKSIVEGNDKTLHKVKHAKPCCWTTTFKKDGKVCGIVLFFQTGVIEIRSFPDLELMKEVSVMAILRWNFKANMDKTISSDNAQISLVNGCEVAFISLLAGENEFRIPESLPCLHDKVLQAAADAAFSFSSNQKKKQANASGLLGGMVKGFKGEKVNATATHESDFLHLESIFLKPPFSDKNAQTVTVNQEVEELDIDDIEIDENLTTAADSSHVVIKTKGEREKLLGTLDDTKPRLRTPQEIIAKYRKAEDATSAASHARNKLVQRQEKLERISRRTEELQSGAEDFASLADELVKTLENRKWWQI